MLNKIIAKSPTRIDLAGGTLDCWPINALLSPVSTINMAIDIFTSCELVPRSDDLIKVSSPDLGKIFSFADLPDCLACQDRDFQFFREHINFWAPSRGFELSARSESPIGGGLGGSSSLSVSIFKVFNQWLGHELSMVEAVAICAGIEAKILRMPTGTQDYFPAYQGGLNVIDYVAGQPTVATPAINFTDFSNSISLFYTGKAHHSGINNWQVIKSFIDQEAKTVEGLEQIRVIADGVKMAVKHGDFAKLPQLFAQEYDARILLADSFGSAEIQKIFQVAAKSGALATKICGAGGGGCVFTWSEPECKARVEKACIEAGFQHLKIGFV